MGERVIDFVLSWRLVCDTICDISIGHQYCWLAAAICCFIDKLTEEFQFISDLLVGTKFDFTESLKKKFFCKLSFSKPQKEAASHLTGLPFSCLSVQTVLQPTLPFMGIHLNRIVGNISHAQHSGSKTQSQGHFFYIMQQRYLGIILIFLRFSVKTLCE